MDHMKVQMEHRIKPAPIKGIFLQRANVTGGIEVFTQRVTQNLETRFVSSVGVAVIR